MVANPNAKPVDDFAPYEPESALSDVKFKVGYALQYFLKACRSACLSQSEVHASVEGDDIRVKIKGGVPAKDVIAKLLGSLGGAVAPEKEGFFIKKPATHKVTQLINNVNEVAALAGKLEGLGPRLGIDAPTVKAREDGKEPAFIIETDYSPNHANAEERQMLGREVHARLAGGTYDRAGNKFNDDCHAALQGAIKRTRNDDSTVYTYQLEVDARRPEPANHLHLVLNKELLVAPTEKFARLMQEAKIPARKIEFSMGTTGEMPSARFVITGEEDRAMQIVHTLLQLHLPAKTILEKPLNGVKCTFPVPDGVDMVHAINHALDKAAETLASDPKKYVLSAAPVRKR